MSVKKYADANGLSEFWSKVKDYVIAHIDGEVTGVKGDNEGSYRTGNVNITKDNIGLGNVENKSSSDILDMFYPVGSYYETSDANFNPNTAWGGTWEKETEGSALISGSASGTYRVGQSYGANSLSYTPAGSVGVTVYGHALTINEMPSHNHTLTIVGNQSITTGGVRLLSQWNKGQTIPDQVYYTGGSQAHSHSASGSFSGTAATLNVMQKSKAVYIWHRIA